MRLTVSAHVPNAWPREARDWWTAFEDGHADHAFIPGAQREVAESRGRSEVIDRVRWFGVLVWKEHFTAWREEGAVRFEGENPLSRFEGRYVFERAGEGTRIVLQAVVRLKGPLRYLAWLARPVAWLAVWLDLKGHARDLARDHTRGR